MRSRGQRSAQGHTQVRQKLRILLGRKHFGMHINKDVFWCVLELSWRA